MPTDLIRIFASRPGVTVSKHVTTFPSIFYTTFLLLLFFFLMRHAKLLTMDTNVHPKFKEKKVLSL